MFVILRMPRPLFVSVTVRGLLAVKTTVVGKATPTGDRVTAGNTPTLPSETVCGLLGALSVKTSDAVRVPVALGVKVTLTMQLVPAVSDEPQLFVCEKSPLFVPPTPIVTVRGILPGFMSVTT